MNTEQIQRWNRTLFTRRSVRTYDGTPLPPGAPAAFRTLEPEQLPGVRARHVLVEGADVTANVLTGLVGSYGRIIGSPAVLLFIGSRESAGSMAAVGYVGQQAILEATAVGLSTCWVAGAFDRKAVGRYVSLAAGEEVICVSPVGAPAQTSGLRRMHDLSLKLFTPGAGKRKPLDQLAEGDLTPPWVRLGLEAARWAPSSVNRQPWRFRVSGDMVSVGYEGGLEGKVGMQDLRPLDCGIAMANFAVAARATGAPGHWQLSEQSGLLAQYRRDKFPLGGGTNE